MARRANREDECTGRFWEGRFKSQRVYDVGALISCSAYIDLNPIRAKSASTPEDSDFTSIQDRIRSLRYAKISLKQLTITPRLLPIEEASSGRLTAEQYLRLIDETGRIHKEGKGKISPETVEILTRLKIKSERWLDTSNNCSRRFRRVVGPVDALVAAAKKIGKRWFHGQHAARLAFY